MKFYNRKKELQELENFYFSKNKEFLVLYGRRRLGKTRLLREFSSKYLSLFFSCPLSTQKEALRLFQIQMAESFNEPLLKQTSFPGWTEAINYATEKAIQNNMVIIFDEFPYLMKSVPGIDSILQHLWDKTEDNMKIILSGSLISVMLEDVLGPKAPLYGRRTYTINLSPMSFFDISLFYTKVSFEEYVKWYTFYGGVPAYAERASIYENSESSLIEMVLNSNGNLYHEPDFLVNEELREPRVYFSVLRSLSSGNTRPNKISQDAGIVHSSVSKYLDILRKMHIIEKRVPITEKNPEKSTKGLYFIKDNFLRFWFRYVFSNKSVIEFGRGKELFDKIIKQDLNILIGYVYEDICLQKIKNNSLKLLGFDAIKFGKYWEKNFEIDVIAENPFEMQVAFIECKWSNSINIDRTLIKLKRNSDMIKYYAGWKKKHFIISRNKKDHPNNLCFNELI